MADDDVLAQYGTNTILSQHISQTSFSSQASSPRSLRSTTDRSPTTALSQSQPPAAFTGIQGSQSSIGGCSDLEERDRYWGDDSEQSNDEAAIVVATTRKKCYPRKTLRRAGELLFES